MLGRVKILRNKDVKFIIAFIPPGHRHVRVVLGFDDEVIVLQQATIDALIRAYAEVALHPRRVAVKLINKRLSKHERKEGFSEYQLLEVSEGEEQVLREALQIYYGNDETHATDSNEEHATG